MSVFENMVLKRIFGPEREKVTGGKKNLHNEEFCELYFSGCYSGDQVKKDEVGGACGTHG